jgi:hypothetical protein
MHEVDRKILCLAANAREQLDVVEADADHWGLRIGVLPEEQAKHCAHPREPGLAVADVTRSHAPKPPTVEAKSRLGTSCVSIEDRA